MIKVVRIKPQHARILRLEFSDGSSGDYDLAPLIARRTSLTLPLEDEQYFRRVFLELGAVAWPNGLELAANALHAELKETGRLNTPARVA